MMTLALLALAATLQQAPPQRPREFSVAGLADTTYGCVSCHAEKRNAFVQGVHAQRGIRCANCHGGDPSAFTLPAGHRGNFIGKPSKAQIVTMCGSCHADPNRMRQYGLPTGMLAEYRTSRHGQLLAQGNQDAPTCTDCHDAHTILRPDDARSTVYPTNIPRTCAKCHDNTRMMAKYHIPTDQLTQFTRSAHGLALFQDQNFAAPSCVGCHGSHSTQPPQGTEVIGVCSRCHQLVGEALDRGPHANLHQAGKPSGCLACHDNHNTEVVPSDRIAATCTRCHAAGSHAATLGTQIQERAQRATADLRGADSAVQRLVAAGVPVGDARIRYQTALTSYLQIAVAQHTLDVDRLDDLGRRVNTVSRDLRGMADVADERRWEHRLLLVVVWFLALGALSLAWLQLRSLEGPTGKS